MGYNRHIFQYWEYGHDCPACAGDSAARMNEMKEPWANGPVTFADTVEIVVEAAHPAAFR